MASGDRNFQNTQALEKNIKWLYGNIEVGSEEVATATFETVANTENGDYIVVYDASNTGWAVFADKSDVQVDDLTFETQANMDDGEYVAITASDGTVYAVAADKTGGTAVTPSGAPWDTADETAFADISGDTTAADVAATFETAFNALTGFTSDVTLDDTAADGSMSVTQVTQGAPAEPVSQNPTSASAGNVTIAQTTDGTDAVPSGAVYASIGAANKARADISGDTSAADVAATFETAFDALTGFTSVITSDDTAADGTMTFTSATAADLTDAATYDEDDGTSGSISVSIADGEALSVTGEGFSGVSRNNDGDYTLTLDDAYDSLLYANFRHAQTTVADIRFQIRNLDLSASSKTIRFYFLTGATPTEPANGQNVYVALALRNTDVYL